MAVNTVHQVYIRKAIAPFNRPAGPSYKFVGDPESCECCFDMNEDGNSDQVNRLEDRDVR